MNDTIAYFTFNLSSYSGAAQQALSLARHLAGHRVVFFNVEAGRARVERDETTWPGHLVYHLPTDLKRSIPAVARLALQHRIRLFHLHGVVGVGLLVGTALRRRIVLKTTLLGSDDLESIRRGPRGRLLLQLVRRVDANVALSEAIERSNARHLPSARIHRIPNGVEVRDDARPKTAPVFCVVGLVCPRKRTHVAIQRFLTEYAHLEGAKLYVVGPKGSASGIAEADDAYLDRCEKLADAANRAKVVFTGPLSKTELQAIYDESLGLFCFSESEGMPNAVLEAMASNCVPVLGPIGGVAIEIVPERRYGYVLSPDEPGPDLDALRHCSASLAPVQRMREAFSFDVLARRYEALYAALLER
jgi:glycosyltransferase involved in cell wall biosynthesis